MYQGTDQSTGQGVTIYGELTPWPNPVSERPAQHGESADSCGTCRLTWTSEGTCHNSCGEMAGRNRPAGGRPGRRESAAAFSGGGEGRTRPQSGRPDGERPSETTGVQAVDASRPQRLRPSSPVQGGWSVQRNRLPAARRPAAGGSRTKRLGGDNARSCQPAAAVGGPCVRASPKRSWKGSGFPQRGNGEPTGGAGGVRHVPVPRPRSEMPEVRSETRRGSPAIRSRGNRSGAGSDQASPAGESVFSRAATRRRGGGFWLGRVRGAAGRSAAGRRVQGPAGAELRRTRRASSGGSPAPGRESPVCEPGQASRAQARVRRIFDPVQSPIRSTASFKVASHPVTSSEIASLSKLHKRRLSERSQRLPEPKSSPSRATNVPVRVSISRGFCRLDVRLIPVEVNGTSRS